MMDREAWFNIICLLKSRLNDILGEICEKYLERMGNLKKLGRITAVLVIAGALVIGTNFSANTVEAASTSKTIGSTSLGSKWRDGEIGFQAGCALSEWLGWFKCHPSQVPW